MSSRHTIKLIAGLGNPGSRYEATRHNAGFWLVDRLASRAGVTLTQQNKFHGDVAKARLDGHDVWLLKPQTFMNESGNALRALASFYKVEPQEILVAHDEVDLPAGTVRLKHGGGHGGNNGLRSICAHLGNDFTRLRLGVGRPPKGGDMTAHVLGRPGASEQRVLDDALIEAERALDILLADGREKAMHWLHSSAPTGGKQEEQNKTAEKPATGSTGPSSNEIPTATRRHVAPATPGGQPSRPAAAAGDSAGADTRAATPDHTASNDVGRKPGRAEKTGNAKDDEDDDQAISLRDQLRGLFRRGGDS